MSSVDRAAAASEPRSSLSFVLSDGLYAGLIGAIVVAAWFLILDSLAGHPLRTPSMLGTWIIRGPGAVSDAMVDPAMVAAYTAVHFIAFVLVGSIASYLFALGDRQPAAVVGLLFLFAFFEAGFFVFSAVMGGQLIGRLGAWAVGVGNLLAAMGMALYLWFRHPHLKENIAHMWDPS
jgi:hypothetical protein